MELIFHAYPKAARLPSGRRDKARLMTMLILWPAMTFPMSGAASLNAPQAIEIDSGTAFRTEPPAQARNSEVVSKRTCARPRQDAEEPKPANVGQPSDGWTGAAITLAVLGAIILGFGGYWLWAMWKTRVIRQALRVANAGDVASAIELLEQHVRQKGPSGPAYNALAVLRVKQERWDDALRDLDEAERLWGRRAVLLSNRGFILWKMGRPADALKPFEDAVHLKPKDIVLRCNHGCLLAELGRRGEAEEQLDRVARLAVEQKAHNQVVPARPERGQLMNCGKRFTVARRTRNEGLIASLHSHPAASTRLVDNVCRTNHLRSQAVWLPAV